MENLNDKIFELHHEGLAAGKIAQKLKVKKTEVLNILGEAGKPQGLGDVIEAVTKATGIKAVVDALVDDCGCSARKETLNKLFPSRKLNDLPTEDFKYLDKYFSGSYRSVTPDQQKELVRIYNGVFNSKRDTTNCSPCLAGLVSELKTIYNAAN